jgi:hypothetical protein
MQMDSRGLKINFVSLGQSKRTRTITLYVQIASGRSWRCPYAVEKSSLVVYIGRAVAGWRGGIRAPREKEQSNTEKEDGSVDRGNATAVSFLRCQLEIHMRKCDKSQSYAYHHYHHRYFVLAVGCSSVRPDPVRARPTGLRHN